MMASAAHGQQFINILTGGTSGVYYPLGVAVGKIYDDRIPGVAAPSLLGEFNYSDPLGYALAILLIVWQWRKRTVPLAMATKPSL
jgi:hypothetical protein